jgi:hypothetical protein
MDAVVGSRRDERRAPMFRCGVKRVLFANQKSCVLTIVTIDKWRTALVEVGPAFAAASEV